MSIKEPINKCILPFYFFLIHSPPRQNQKGSPPAFIPQTPFCGRTKSKIPAEKISLGFANPFPQKTVSQNRVRIGIAFPALLLCRSTTPCVVARSARGTLSVSCFENRCEFGSIKTHKIL